MSEELKLQYRAFCSNHKMFYQIMDEWTQFLLANPNVTKKDKLKKLEQFKSCSFELYQKMKEDIQNG